MKTQKFIIDTDIGDEIDDALALVYAMKKGIDIVGITTVYQNTDERARIAKRLISLYGKGYEKVPVFAGIGTPLADKKKEYPHTTHCNSSLLSNDHAPDGDADAAVDFIINSCEKYGKELTVIAIGAFTNIAKVIEKAPEALGKAEKIVIMGGAYYKQYADWNVMCDTEAADIMFSSLDNLECVGADVTHRLELAESELSYFLNYKGDDACTKEISCLFRLWRQSVKDRNPALHDPLAVEYAINTDVCKTERARVKVITDGYARGLTFNVDAYGKASMNPFYADIASIRQVTVAKDIDAKTFIEDFMKVF